ncbi:MAG TPA: AAC(3) family N-acetyltransferase, partial [Candidatus Acidoferrum sp.]|nr:AAC(3) family N-acetyltransferase [Candidatus Acidoferrum sp.]
AVSFAAWGKHAQFITGNHQLENSLGEGSPLARLYDLDGWVLLVGVGYDRNTSFHLAEYRADGAKQEFQGAAVFENGGRTWKVYADIEVDSDIFPEIGTDMEWENNRVLFGEVGNAQARLFRVRAAVDFAQGWLVQRRRSN